MNSSPRLSNRVDRLRQLQAARGLSGLSPAAPLTGDWPPGCMAYEASFAQARLWFLHQLDPGLTAYHLPAVWKLRGDLDVAALESALAGLIERHSTLRTSFQLQGSEVIQIVHAEVAFALAAEVLGERDVEDVIKEWLEDESRTPFDLTAGLLLRARLLRVEDHQHVLLINHHHIASDGWSLSVMDRDLVELYNAERMGRSAQLEPLSVHYPDYAQWQRQRLSGERLQELNDYWMGQLRDLEPLELPSDHPRPVTPTYVGESVCFQIEPALLEPFEELCRREGATLQMGLLAVVALLLHRYSRQEDFAIGVPIWGRNHSELENLIGFFINTLPIRTRFEREQSFRELLVQVRDTSIGAYEHQELPFEQMVEALNVERDTSRNPLVQVMLQVMELPVAGLEQLDGVAVQSLPTRSESAKFDLSFYLRRSGDEGLSGSITYAMDLFDGERIERLSSHLITLLSSVVQGADQPASALNLLPEAERQLIESWQQGPVVEVPELCVHELFEQQVERTPEAVAVVFGEQEISYGELNARANRLAHVLMARGVGPAVIVAVCLDRSIELVVALLAILKAGGAYLPLDPAWPPQRIGQILADAAPALVIGAAGLEVPCGNDRPTPLLRLDDPALGLERQSEQSPDSSCHSGQQLAYLTTTSGSTGVPKGVLIEHCGILRLLDPANPYAISSGERVLQLAPLPFDAATFEIWGALLNGATLVLAPPGKRSLQDLAALLRVQRISTLWLTAGLFQAMVEEQPEALAGVRQILAGGDVLAPGAVQRLLDRLPAGHQLINGYGPTENTTFTCCHCLAAGDTVAPAGVPIGRPIAATLVRVLDRDGHPCPIGVHGELHIGGAGLARGYLNNPGLTAEKFIADPFAPDPTVRLFRSGDLVSWNADGSLAFHGRNDQQIKLRGFRIEPGEIEAALLEHPAVAQAVVVLQKDDPANPRLIAYLVPQTRPATEQLRAFLAERLPDYMVPAAFVELEALPLTSNGKLDRKALPAPSFSEDGQQRVEPATDLQRQLHAIWAEVLGHGEFGTSDNFFEIGGHSLAAARLVARIEENLGQRLPLASLFQYPTLAALASRLNDREYLDHHRFRSLVILQAQGEASPLFVIHGGGGDVFIHVHLARSLAPRRPVYGLQAVGIDGSEARHRTVEEMASHYASEILRIRPQGPFHLLGYSGGGWYAWATAAELLRRGGCLGLVGLVDTRGTADLHRRLRLQQLLRNGSQQLLRQLSHWRGTPALPQWNSLRRKLEALRFHGWTLLRTPGGIAPDALDPEATPRPTQPIGGDYFLQLHTYYRPPRLPVRADIFSTPSVEKNQRKLWNFYATGKAYLHPVLLDHNDYYDEDFMPAFAELLDALVNDIES